MSAGVAKDRLLWCVKSRRDGGYWVGTEWQYASYYLLDGTVRHAPTCPLTARWVYA